MKFEDWIRYREFWRADAEETLREAHRVLTGTYRMTDEDATDLISDIWITASAEYGD